MKGSIHHDRAASSAPSSAANLAVLGYEDPARIQAGAPVASGSASAGREPPRLSGPLALLPQTVGAFAGPMTSRNAALSCPPTNWISADRVLDELNAVLPLDTRFKQLIGSTHVDAEQLSKLKQALELLKSAGETNTGFLSDAVRSMPMFNAFVADLDRHLPSLRYLSKMRLFGPLRAAILWKGLPELRVLESLYEKCEEIHSQSPRSIATQICGMYVHKGLPANWDAVDAMWQTCVQIEQEAPHKLFCSWARMNERRCPPTPQQIEQLWEQCHTLDDVWTRRLLTAIGNAQQRCGRPDVENLQCLWSVCEAIRPNEPLSAFMVITGALRRKGLPRASTVEAYWRACRSVASGAAETASELFAKTYRLHVEGKLPDTQAMTSFLASCQEISPKQGVKMAADILRLQPGTTKLPDVEKAKALWQLARMLAKRAQDHSLAPSLFHSLAIMQRGRDMPDPAQVNSLWDTCRQLGDGYTANMFKGVCWWSAGRGVPDLDELRQRWSKCARDGASARDGIVRMRERLNGSATKRCKPTNETPESVIDEVLPRLSEVARSPIARDPVAGPAAEQVGDVEQDDDEVLAKLIGELPPEVFDESPELTDELLVRLISQLPAEIFDESPEVAQAESHAMEIDAGGSTSAGGDIPGPSSVPALIQRSQPSPVEQYEGLHRERALRIDEAEQGHPRPLIADATDRAPAQLPKRQRRV